ncbi:MAG: type II toxin-antitoxin system prevent-host-death family antitoxin [Candidatus Dormibacteraeota bacterium]|nr:type II toxin-antitoxin system prevent-host-death family antitoxin [Candidatus Dormibacteraeota bacterium]
MSTPISALQRNAAAVVRRVAASGRSEEITDRGRVIAVLAPPPALIGLEKLIAEGAARPPRRRRDIRELLDEIERLQPPAGLMEALEEQRDTDR